MMRLGKKYGFRSLYADAARRVAHDYPTNFADFLVGSESSQIDLHGCSLSMVVNLVRETGFACALPYAFYCICSGSLEDALETIIGKQCEGKTLPSLSDDDKNTCILACTRLLRAQADHTFAWLDTDLVSSRGCHTPKKCKTGRANIRRDVWKAVPVIMAIEEWVFDYQWEDELCEECIGVAKVSHKKGRREVWSRLPSYFDLPSWEELKKDSA